MREATLKIHVHRAGAASPCLLSCRVRATGGAPPPVGAAGFAPGTAAGTGGAAPAEGEDEGSAGSRGSTKKETMRGACNDGEQAGQPA